MLNSTSTNLIFSSLITNLQDNNFLIELSYIFIIYFSLKIITARNPMLSIVFLIGVFILVSISLVYLNLSIMALLYLLVYVGAIAILFLFILSLLNLNYSELNSSSLFKEFILLSSSSGLIYYLLYSLFNNSLLLDLKYLNLLKLNNFELNTLPVIKELDWNIMNELNELQTIGQLLYTENSFLFLLLGLILLLTIIGAISLVSYRSQPYSSN